MTQGPLPATVSRKPTTATAQTPTAQAPLLLDFSGTLLTGQGAQVAYNISAATVVKATPGRVGKVVVITAGSTVGTVNNCITTGAAAIANQLAAIPDTIGPIPLDMPCSVGITIVPGTGQVVAVSFT